MSLEVVTLSQEHLEQAAALAAARYERFRDQLPLLPPQYAEKDTLLPMLQEIVEAGSGVVALDGDRLVGFLAAWILPSFRGRRSAFSPEWANGAEGNSRRIYEEMYTQLSAQRVEDGTRTHLISTLVDDPRVLDTWHWLGFGMIAADAIRGLEPADGLAAEVPIRRAGPADVEDAVRLTEALRRHTASAPTFLAGAPIRDADYYRQWLSDPANVLWLAYDGDEAVAFMRHGPASTDACTVIRDEKTTSVVGAFTAEGMRGNGIATASLNRVLEQARSDGYERCAVDFEPMNPPAARFWLRHFQPVCYTLVRHITP